MMMTRVVKASAGTGKTYRISVEFIATLLRMGLQTGYTRDDIYREILVITFTRKATSEIRERIFEHLGMIVRREEGYLDILRTTLDEQQFDFLHRVFDSMRRNKHLLMIRTIDGFTQLVFQQLVAPAMQLDDFTVINDNDDEVYQLILERIIEDKPSLDAFSSVFQKYIHRGKDLSAYRNLVRGMIDNRWLFDIRSMLAATQSTGNAYQQYRLTLVDFIGTRLSRDIALGEYFIKSDLRAAIEHDGIDWMNFETVIPTALNDDMLRIHAAGFLAEKIFSKRKTSDELREVYHREVFPHLLRGVFDDIRKEETTIRGIAQSVFHEYDRIKMQAREFTHNDILWYTYQMLHRDEMGLIDPSSNMVTNLFYEFLTQRIRYIFIDEFQDTSILQWKLLEPLLIEYASGYGTANYGGFIIVGDEKQAIYGWRGGERELLGKIGSVFPTVEQETLSTCYRSHKGILDFVNGYFGAISRTLGEHIWQYDAVDHLPYKTAGYVEVRFDHYSYSKNTPRSKDLCYSDFVQKMIAPRFAVDAEKPLRMQDSVILARTNKDLDRIALELDSIGIPYIHESSASLAEHKLVKPLIFLLRYLAWFDLLDLLVFLRSDYFLMSNELLTRILLWYRRNKDGEHSLDFLRKLAEAVDDQSLNDLTSVLADQMAKPQLYRVLAETIGRHGSTGWNQVDLRNLAKFMEYVQRSDQDSVYGFLRELEKNRGDDALSQVGLEEGDAIRLMSIHKSKGLQFDNTFVFQQFSNRGGGNAGLLRLQSFYRLSPESVTPEELLLCNSEYVSLLKNCLEGAHGTPFEQAHQLMQHDDLADFTDQINALYVALTRAKNNLFLYAVMQATDIMDGVKKAQIESGTLKSLAGYLYQVLENGIDEEYIYRSGEITVTGDAEEVTQPRSNAEVETVMRYLNRANAYHEDVISDPQNAHLLIASHRNDAISRGEIVHLCLSMIRTGTQKEFEAARTAAYRDFGGIYGVEEIDNLLDRLREWAKNYPDIFSAKWTRIFNEIPIFDDDGSEYRIDRLLIDDEDKQILIVDYKTGGISEAWQERKYVEIVMQIVGGEYTVEFRYAEVRV